MQPNNSYFHRRQRGVIMVAGALALTMLAACGGATVNSSGPSTSSSSSETASSSATSSAAGSSAGTPVSSAGGGSASSAGSAGPTGPTVASSGSGGASPTMLPVSGDCAPFNLAMNDWVGYTADAAVLTYVAQNDLKCKVTQKALKEEIAWQGFPSSQIDVIMENWGHLDLVKKYIDTQKVARDAGLTGNLGQIGWFVPPWMAAKYPDITDYRNLNKYASLFKTSESGGKGQFLDGDPSFVQNDEALVKNLNLDFKVVYAGSEAALIQAFRTAEQNKTPLLGYFYSPQWFLAEVPLVRIALPPFKTGCDSVPAKVACDYESLKLNKIISSKFADSGSAAVNLVKNFHWTNDDQNLVAKYITADKMSPSDAAKKWVDANPDKVKAWLGK